MEASWKKASEENDSCLALHCIRALHYALESRRSENVTTFQIKNGFVITLTYFWQIWYSLNAGSVKT